MNCLYKSLMEGLFKNKYRIASARLSGFDYSEEGYYFVTICIKNRKCLFGNVYNKEIFLSDIGKMVQKEWLNTENVRSNVKLDKFIVMPNHLHGIIIITSAVETHCNASLQCNDTYKNKFGPQTNNLSSIIRGFKGSVKKQINEKYGKDYFSWQPKFYDHVIRNEESLFNIRNYIQMNPENWERDRNNPENLWI